MSGQRPAYYTQAYIGGQWTDSRGAATDVTNPATGQVVTVVHDSTPEQVDHAVTAARAALAAWSAVPVAARAAVVGQISDGLAARAGELAETLSQEMGAPISAARTHMISMARNDAVGFVRAAGQLVLSEQVGTSLVVREPVGVVAAITPWNAPLHQIAMKIFPALIAGCTVVLKPSELAPSCAAIFVDIAARAGLPAGVLNLVTGGGAVGGHLAADTDVDMVSFTGSVAVGRKVAEMAASTVKKVTLELGGKSACIVVDGADLTAAVEYTVASSFRNSGQVCAALTLLLVPRSRLTEVEQLAAAAARSWMPGDPAAEETVLGPVVSERQRERVVGYLAQGIAEGARLVCGSTARPVAEAGAFVEPAVFSDVRPDMTIAREEIFGPVLSIIPYTTLPEAIGIANGTRYGLAAAVWAADQQQAYDVARQLKAGVIRLNGGGDEVGAPFGGSKQSGLGREGGLHGILEFTEFKTISAPTTPSMT